MINKSIATTEAVRRIAYVLQQKLEEELQTLSSALEAPSKQAFYLARRFLDSELLNQHPSVCVIEQENPSREINDISRKGNEVAAESILPVRIRIAFIEPTSFEPKTVLGKQQSKSEWMQHQSEILAGAVINTVKAYAPDDYSVQDVNLLGDMAQIMPLEEDNSDQLVGGCIIDLEILQTVAYPAATFSI